MVKFFFSKMHCPISKRIAIHEFCRVCEDIIESRTHLLKNISDFLEDITWAFKVFHVAFWLCGGTLAENVMKTSATCLLTVSFLPSFNYWNLFISQFALIGFFNYKEPWRVNGGGVEITLAVYWGTCNYKVLFTVCITLINASILLCCIFHRIWAWQKKGGKLNGGIRGDPADMEKNHMQFY